MHDSNIDPKVILITGAGKRVGATIARYCHRQGMRIAVHYRSAEREAKALAEALNQQRHNSAMTLQADLQNTHSYEEVINTVIAQWGTLDGLINNASSFFATPFGDITAKDCDDLLGSNLKAPLFLSQAAMPFLKKQNGSIINLVDIQAQRPMRNYSVYCVAKAGLVLLTKCLAKELGPWIRVNGLAPGIALWPDNETELSAKTREKIVNRTALKRVGTPEDIAEAVVFLIQQARYITGQIIAIDGGLSLDY